MEFSTSSLTAEAGALDDLARGDEVRDVAVELDDLRHRFPPGQKFSCKSPNDSALMSACSVMGAQMVPAFS